MRVHLGQRTGYCVALAIDFTGKQLQKLRMSNRLKQKREYQKQQIQLDWNNLKNFKTGGNKKRSGRGREIRTPDILLPKQARYQTALYPERVIEWLPELDLNQRPID